MLLRQVLRGRDRAQLVRLVAVNALVAAILALLAWLMLARQFDDFASTQLSGAPVERSAWQLLVLLAASLESDLLRFFWMPWSGQAPRALLLLPAALAAAGVAGLAARGGRFATPLAIGAASIGLMWVAYLLGLYPFGFRYALFLSPLLFLLVAEGLCRLARRRALAIAVGLAVVASQIAFLPNLPLGNPWLAPPHENLARALDWVAMRAAGGEAVYVYYGALPAFALYRDRIELPVLRGASVRHLPPAEKVAAVVRPVRGHERFFLVASHLWGDETDVLVSGLTSPAGGFRLVDARVERGAYAALLERVGPT